MLPDSFYRLWAFKWLIPLIASLCLLFYLVKSPQTAAIIPHSTALVLQASIEPCAIHQVNTGVPATVLAIIAHPGNRVKNGDALLRFHSNEAEEKLLKALATEKKINQRHQQLEKKAKVYQDLMHEGVISSLEYQQIVHELDNIQYESVNNERSLHHLCPLLEKSICDNEDPQNLRRALPLVFTLSAHADGTLLQAQHDLLRPGEHLSADHAVFTIANYEKILLTVALNHEELKHFTLQDRVQVAIEDEAWDLTATVTAITNQSEPSKEKDTILVHLSSDTLSDAQQNSIKPGSKAMIRTHKGEQQFLLPKSAIHQGHVTARTKQQTWQTIAIAILEDLGTQVIVSGPLHDYHEVRL